MRPGRALRLGGMITLTGWTACPTDRAVFLHPPHAAVTRDVRPAVRRGRARNGPSPGGNSGVLVVDPAHELAELLAGGLQQGLAVGLLVLVVLGQTVVVLGHPVLGEGAVLDFGEDLLHLGLGGVRDDARAGDVVAPL